MARAITARSPARMPRLSRAMSGRTMSGFAGSVRVTLARPFRRSRYSWFGTATGRHHDRQGAALHRLIGARPREHEQLLGRRDAATRILRLGAELFARRRV